MRISARLVYLFLALMVIFACGGSGSGTSGSNTKHITVHFANNSGVTVTFLWSGDANFHSTLSQGNQVDVTGFPLDTTQNTTWTFTVNNAAGNELNHNSFTWTPAVATANSRLDVTYEVDNSISFSPETVSRRH